MLFCVRYRVVYKVAYREAYVMQTEQQVVYACCPGWTQYKKGDIACMKRKSGGVYNDFQ